jgi:hypothetical protein
MTDLQQTKQHFLEIGLNFTSCTTLIGATITIYPDGQREVDFEYDMNGKFIRII